MFALALLGIALVWTIGTIIYHIWFKKKQHIDLVNLTGFNNSQATLLNEEGLELLELLDQVYTRLKRLTRETIRNLQKEDWRGMQAANKELMWLTEMDVESAINKIMVENVFRFATGKPLTVVEDTKKLATKIKSSSLFTRNPEHVASDLSVILNEKIPYLKKRMEHDRLYKKLQQKIERQTDKFPNDDVSKTIDMYLEHSVKLNAAWVMSVHDLDNLGFIEKFTGRHMPMNLKIILWGLPGRMDEEMRTYRKQVAKAILKYLEGL